MGVSRAAHTQYAYIWKYPPPPLPRGAHLILGHAYLNTGLKGVLAAPLYWMHRASATLFLMQHAFYPTDATGPRHAPPPPKKNVCIPFCIRKL